MHVDSIGHRANEASSATSVLTMEWYDALIGEAHATVSNEDFSVLQFVTEAKARYDGSCGADRVKNAVITAEVLGHAMTNADDPYSLDRYVELRRTLRDLPESERQFCRTCLQTAARELSKLDLSELQIGPDLVTPQLMTMLI